MSKYCILRAAAAALTIGILIFPQVGPSAQPMSAAQSLNESYLLGAGDQLKINVFGSADLSGEFRVTDSGTISYPLLGTIDVHTMTAPSLQLFLQTRLGQGYVENPRVTIEIMKYRPFYVYGEVLHSGEYPFNTRLTLRQAIATAGGLSYRASSSHVYLQRAGQGSEQRYDLRHDLLVAINPGDTIRVGERHF